MRQLVARRLVPVNKVYPSSTLNTEASLLEDSLFRFSFPMYEFF
jgi:hypothetical protein